jgi:16S rRNA (guanine966-N2)-methyltransferase
MSSLATPDTLIIFEAALDTQIGFLDKLGYELVKEKCYKTNKHVFCRKIAK